MRARTHRLSCGERGARAVSHVRACGACVHVRACVHRIVLFIIFMYIVLELCTKRSAVALRLKSHHREGVAGPRLQVLRLDRDRYTRTIYLVALLRTLYEYIVGYYVQWNSTLACVPCRPAGRHNVAGESAASGIDEFEPNNSPCFVFTRSCTMYIVLLCTMYIVQGYI